MLEHFELEPVELATQLTISLIETLTESLAVVQRKTMQSDLTPLYLETEKRILESLCMAVTLRVKLENKQADRCTERTTRFGE